MGEQIWVHNLNPFLLQLSETIGIRWYGMAYLSGFVFGTMIIFFIAKRGRQTMPPDLGTDFVTYVVLGTMIGGRLGYALFYSPDLLTDFSGAFPYWGVLRVWEGGMASHGGIIGVFTACVLFARRNKLNWMHMGDLVVLGGSVGILFGRIANFINGELFGREAPPGFPYAVKFPGEMFLWLRHDREMSGGPDLLPKMTAGVKALGANIDQWNSWVAQVRTSPTARYQIQVMINDLIHAIQGGNEAVRSAIGAVLTPRYPSQLIESLLEGGLTFIVAFIFWYKPRKPGVVGSLWLTLYAIVRIFGEQFRMPDAEIGFQLFGLTRGQWISCGQLVISIGLLVWTSTRAAPVIAGWGPEAQKLRDLEKAGK
jgi:phosphatidylglycerol:prolipoprotein diacylglycerol transferase